MIFTSIPNSIGAIAVLAVLGFFFLRFIFRLLESGVDSAQNQSIVNEARVESDKWLEGRLKDLENSFNSIYPLPNENVVLEIGNELRPRIGSRSLFLTLPYGHGLVTSVWILPTSTPRSI